MGPVITETAGLLERMLYLPRQVEVANNTSTTQPFEVDFYSGEFLCRTIPFELLPGTSVRVDALIGDSSIILKGRVCVLRPSCTDHFFFLNCLERPTRSSCKVALEEVERPHHFLPPTFEEGFEVKGASEKTLAVFDSPLSRRLREHYSVRYEVFMSRLRAERTAGCLKTLLNAESLVPMQFHFIWIGSLLSSKNQRNIATWRKHHPDWKITLHVHFEPRALDSEEGAYFLAFCEKNGIVLASCDEIWKRFLETAPEQKVVKEVYDYAVSIRAYAMASDVLRMAILYLEGGIYIDCDNPCFRPFHFLTKSLSFFAGLSPVFKGHIKVNNDVIGSAPMHPIVLNYFERVLDKFSNYYVPYAVARLREETEEWKFVQSYQVARTIDLTGPMAVSYAYRMYVNAVPDSDVLVFPPSVFHPAGKSSCKFFGADQPAPESFSAAHFDMSWIDSKEAVEGLYEFVGHAFSKQAHLVLAELEKIIASGKPGQLHCFEFRITTGATELIEWLLADPHRLAQFEVLDFILTDVTETVIRDCLLPALKGDVLVMLPRPVGEKFEGHPNVFYFKE